MTKTSCKPRNNTKRFVAGWRRWGELLDEKGQQNENHGNRNGGTVNKHQVIKPKTGFFNFHLGRVHSRRSASLLDLLLNLFL